MIYTITFNPALDYISQVDSFETGKINRTKTEKILPGGKGLNVSIVFCLLSIRTPSLSMSVHISKMQLLQAKCSMPLLESLEV